MKGKTIIFIVLWCFIFLSIFLFAFLIDKEEGTDNLNIKDNGLYVDFSGAPILEGPADRIKLEDIQIKKDFFIVNDIEIDQISYFNANSSSMDPIFVKGTEILTIKPKTEKDIKVGDIISFKIELEGKEVNVAHRVHEILKDNKGYLYKTKGDNLNHVDEGERRFENIDGIVIAILY